MSGGVDSSVAAALLVEAGPRRRRRDACASGRGGAGGRSAGDSAAAAGTEAVDDARRVARRARHPVLPPQHGRGVRPRGDRPVRRGLSRRAHAGAVRGVQSGPKVRLAARRALRAWDAVAVATGHYARDRRATRRPGAACCCARATRARIRPTSSGRSRRRSSRAARFPVGDLHQGRGARARAPARPGHGGQAGEPGDLLRPRRRLSRLPAPARARRVPAGSDRRRRRAAALGQHDGRRRLHDRPAARARARGRARRSTSSTSTPTTDTGDRRRRRRPRARPAGRHRRQLHRGRRRRRRRCGSTAKIRHNHEPAAGDRAAAGRTAAPRSSSTSPQRADHARASRSCGTRATWSSGGGVDRRRPRLTAPGIE